MLLLSDGITTILSNLLQSQRYLIYDNNEASLRTKSCSPVSDLPITPFFFFLGFLSPTFTIHRTAGEEGEGIYLTPLYHFHPIHRHIDISRAITAESSTLHIAGSRTRYITIALGLDILPYIGPLLKNTIIAVWWKKWHKSFFKEQHPDF